MIRQAVILYINDQLHEVSGSFTGMMLSDYLRYQLRLTGTKVVCAEGDCGACTVLRYFPLEDGASEFEPINCCITTVAQMDGSAIYTVDALKNSPVQAAMVSCHGSQCGFCTPGFVMALTGLAEKRVGVARIEEQDAKNALTGNLCRCTGYKQILDAACSIDMKKYQSLSISPKTRSRLKSTVQQSVSVQTSGFQFFAPTQLKVAATYLSKNKSVRLIGAGTDLGVARNKNKIGLENLLSLHLVPELYEISRAKRRVRVGARVTLSKLRRELETHIPEFASFLNLFASPQIKNLGTLVGNVANASPIADTPPFLLAARASVFVLGVKGKREIDIAEFFLGYRKTALRPGEFITHIEFDIPAKGEKFVLRKASQRKDLDISCVNAALRMKVKAKTIESVSLALGGVAATPIRLAKTEKALMGQELSSELISKACATLRSEIKPIDDLRGSGQFRRVLAENYLREFLESAP